MHVSIQHVHGGATLTHPSHDAQKRCVHFFSLRAKGPPMQVLRKHERAPNVRRIRQDRLNKHIKHAALDIKLREIAAAAPRQQVWIALLSEAASASEAPASPQVSCSRTPK